MPQFSTDPTRREGRHTVAVLRDLRAAADAREQLLRMGVAPTAVEIDGEVGQVESLRAEMRAELEESIVSPQAAVAYTKESVKGITTLAVVAGGPEFPPPPPHHVPTQAPTEPEAAPPPPLPSG